MMIEREAWEQQPGEGAKAFQAFTIYYSMAPRERSLRETARRYYETKCARNVTTIKRWASRWSWAERALSWDDFQDRLARERLTETIQALRDRHAKQGKALTDLAGELLTEFYRRVEEGGGFSRLSDKQIGSLLHWTVRAIKTGQEAERLAFGLPTEVWQELSTLTEDQLASLEAAIIKLIGGYLSDEEAEEFADRLAGLLAQRDRGGRS